MVLMSYYVFHVYMSLVRQTVALCGNGLNFLQVNCVVMRGLNEDEICDFVAFTEKKVSMHTFGLC